MAGSINKVILVGNLGRDPEVRFSQDGNKIVNMSLATVSYTHLTLPTIYSV